VSLWIVLEKISGAVFGAPLVGYLTSNMLASHEAATAEEDAQAPSAEKAHALAVNLLALSSLFWAVCAFFWVVMSFTMTKSAVPHITAEVADAEMRSLL